MKKNKLNNKNRFTTGFTIIEMMIAISVFLVVIIYGMQALLNSYNVHKKSQDMRQVIDSLTFTLDEMSKNIRTGYNYHCIEEGNNSPLEDPLSCRDGVGIYFKSTKSGNIESNLGYFISDSAILKIVDPINNAPIKLTPDEVKIDISKSGFSVLGAKSPDDGDKQQPFVIIKLTGTIKDTPFSIQTSVSQRLIDVGSTNILPTP